MTCANPNHLKFIMNIGKAAVAEAAVVAALYINFYWILNSTTAAAWVLGVAENHIQCVSSHNAYYARRIDKMLP